MKAAFRVDAGLEAGWGHVSRCLALAGHLRADGAEVEFLCRPQQGDAIAYLAAAGFQVKPLPLTSSSELDDASACLACLPLHIDLLVVDHYGLGSAWERQLRGRCRLILAIDDLADRRHDVDVILDQSDLACRPERYDGLVPDGSLRLIGPGYALLRPEFFAPDFRRDRQGKAERLLVFFGGSDPTDETEKTLSALSPLLPCHEVDVIIGAATRNIDRIQALCADMGAGLSIQTQEVAQHMAKADIALGSCGVAALERCAMALPTIAVIAAENQREMAAALADHGAIKLLGWHADVTGRRWAEALSEVVSDREALRSMSSACRGLVGNGSRQITEWIKMTGKWS